MKGSVSESHQRVSLNQKTSKHLWCSSHHLRRRSWWVVLLGVDGVFCLTLLPQPPSRCRSHDPVSPTPTNYSLPCHVAESPRLEVGGFLGPNSLLLVPPVPVQPTPTLVDSLEVSCTKHLLVIAAIRLYLYRLGLRLGAIQCCAVRVMVVIWLHVSAKDGDCF